MKKAISQITIITTWLLSVPAITHAANTLDDLFQMPLEDLINTEVIGSTRTLQSIAEVPASVTVFTSNDIQKMGIDFLFELISYVPGFQTNRNNDASSNYLYSSRGSGTAQETTAILILVDNVPRMEVRSSSASTLTGMFPLKRIKRIEFIRGPGSALYGSGAFLGVINIITEKDENALSLHKGTLDRDEVYLQLAKNINDWTLNSTLQRYQDDGDTYYLDDRISDQLKKTTDPQTIENLSLNIGYEDTQLSFEHMSFETDEFYNVGVISNDVNQQQYILNTASLKTTTQWKNLDSTFRVNFSENKYKFRAQNSNPGDLEAISNPSSDEPLIGSVYYTGDIWGLQWFNHWEINNNSSLQFGLERNKERISEARILSNYDVSALAREEYPVQYSPEGDIYSKVSDTLSRINYGAYTQAQYHLQSQTHFTLGARVDAYEGFDTQTSLRLAIVHALNDTHSLKLFYGDAYRAPSLFQLDRTENLTEASNPNLKAEKNRTVEAVWLTQQDIFSITASAFYNEINDRIDASGFIDERQVTVNQDTEYSNGFELESSIQLTTHVFVRSGFTKFTKLPDSSYRESERLTFFILNYQRANWWTTLSGYYNSERNMPSENSPPIKGEKHLSWKTGYHLSPSTTISFSAKNLLKEEIASTPQRLGITTPIPYRGREASASIRVQF